MWLGYAPNTKVFTAKFQSEDMYPLAKYFAITTQRLLHIKDSFFKVE